MLISCRSIYGVTFGEALDESPDNILSRSVSTDLGGGGSHTLTL